MNDRDRLAAQRLAEFDQITAQQRGDLERWQTDSYGSMAHEASRARGCFNLVVGCCALFGVAVLLLFIVSWILA